MSRNTEALSSFIQSAPPGELSNVTAAIKTITSEDPISTLADAYKKYNEEQFATVKLPGGSQQVIISSFNKLETNRYYDQENQTSFEFDHGTQKASSTQSYVHESSHSDLTKSLLKSLRTHVDEHYPSASIGVYPTENDSQIAIVIVANKYSPNNFWNGRWRSLYLFNPSSGTLTGSIKVDVHYYEDGNVRLLTERSISSPLSSNVSASEIMKQIAQIERRYQEELNRGFQNLSENAFKSLRRQLPVTRQKVEWDKIAAYKAGQDIGGGRK